MSDSEDQNNGDMEVDAESDSDSEDVDDQDEKFEARAKELEKLITENPYSYDSYVELVDIYKKLMNLSQMRAIYEKFKEVFPLTPKLWLDWIKDEITIATSENEQKYVLTLFELAVKDYLSVDLWLEYVQYAIGHTNTEETRKIFERAVTDAGLHVAKGSLLWDAYREFELAHLSCIPDSDNEKWETQAKRVNDVFKRQLSVTLLDMERTYIEWRVWVEKLPKNDFIDKEPIEWGYKNASKYMDDYKDYEERLLTDEDKISVYRSYIRYERKPEIIRALYERALTDCSLDADLWLEYCKYYFELKNYQSCLDTVERGLRNCPWSSPLWIFQMQAFELSGKSHDEVTEVFEKSLVSIYQNANDFLQLWLTYLEHFRRITNPTDPVSVEKLRSVFQKGFEHLNKNFSSEGDPDCTLLRLWAKIEANVLKNMQEARKIWNDYGILKAHGSMANFWLELIELEKHFGDDKHLQKTYQRALTYTKDWPQCIVQSWIMYERECGTVESMINCMNVCSKYIKKFEKEAAENAANQEEEQNYEHNRKRKHSNERPYYKTKHGKVNKDPKQKVETNSPKKDKTINDIEMKELKLTEDKDKEESPQKEKQFEKIELNEEKQNRSVFISNLDYSVTEEELKSFIGEIEEIRLVTNAKGASKGFAYAILPTADDAQKLLSRDRERIAGRPVFISKCETNKMSREHFFKYSKSTEKHKLFVRGLPMTMNQEEVAEIFKPYGKLKDVRLVTYKNGRSKGLAYVEYESASDASNAIMGTDNTEVRGFTISVAISAPPERKFDKETPKVHEEKRTQKSRIQLPLVPRVLQVPQNQKPTTTALSNDDFRNLLNKK